MLNQIEEPDWDKNNLAKEKVILMQINSLICQKIKVIKKRYGVITSQNFNF